MPVATAVANGKPLARPASESPIRSWTRTPTDGSHNIAQLIDFHAQHNAEHEAFATPSKAYSWAEIAAAIYRLVPLFKDSKVVAIAASGDTLTYFMTMLAVVRAGGVSFAISPNNSTEGFISLINARDVDTVVVTRPGLAPDLERTVNAALEAVPRDLKRIPWPQADFSLIDVPQLPPAASVPFEKVAMIFHSSGSTSHPKPINYTHGRLLDSVRYYQLASDDFLRGEDPFAMDPNARHYTGSLPAFHAFAMCTGFFALLGTASTMCIGDPILPARRTTPAQALAEAQAMGTVDILCVPSFVEEWSKDPKAVEALTKFKMIGYGGAHLDLELGNALVAKGVPLKNMYASTESNLFISWQRPDPALENSWNYVRAARRTNFALRPTGVEGEYEPLVGCNDIVKPHLLNTEYQGQQFWAMGDGVQLHPRDSTLWRITGRLDTQVMLSTGEKVNPTALTPIIERSPLCAGALYFGRGKPFCGVLVQPSEGNAPDLSDPQAVEAFRTALWPFVELANDHAPSHSHVFREMIVVAAEPMLRTAKGSIRIGLVLEANQGAIEEAYRSFGRGSKVTAPMEWTEETALAYTTALIADALGRDASEIPADADIFSTLGGDSLRANKIHNAVNSALATVEAPPNGDALSVPSSFVYQHPTAGQLASALLALVRGEDLDGSEDRTAPLRAMIDKYSGGWPEHRPTRPAPIGEAVLLTGTTGGVGSHALEQAILDPKIVKVYSLSRKGNGSVLDRHTAVFKDRGIDVSLLSSPKLELLEGDLESNEDLDLGLAKYDELRATVTSIIHIAWRLDFNLSLASFEGAVAGSRNLVDLALRSELPTPPPIVFTSSVGTLVNWASTEAVPEEPLEDLSIALSNGYGESKAVTERILLAARHQTPLKTCSVRVGQLCGSTSAGTWAKTDWLPLLVQSGTHPSIASLPSIPGCATWLPSDVCAKVLYDYARSSPLRAEHNLVSPVPISFDAAVSPLARALDVPMIPLDEWLAKLRSVASSDKEALTSLPVLKLLPFFTTVSRGAARAFASLKPGQLEPEAAVVHRLSTDEAVKVSPTLASLKPLTPDDSLRWLSYWRKPDVGLL